MKTAARLLVTLLCYGVILWRSDLKDLGRLLAHAALLPLVAALFVNIAGQVLCAIKWRMLARQVDVHLSAGTAIATYFIGMFFSQFLPTLIGGDLVRVLLMRRRGEASSRVSASIFVERATGLLAMLAIATISAYAIREHLGGVPFFEIFAVGFLGCVVVCAVLLRGRKWRPSRFLPSAAQWMSEAAASVSRFRHAPRLLAVSLVLSILFQFSVILKHSLYAKAVGLPIPFSSFLVYIPVVVLAGMLPISVNGMGVKEAAMVALYTAAGATREEAVAVGVLNLFLSSLAASPGGLLYLREPVRVAALRSTIRDQAQIPR